MEINNNKYDDLIKHYADCYDFNWKLIKMQTMVESQGNPEAVSNVGAKGLMQITDEVWANFGTGDIFNPADNIRAGCKYLQWLNDKFSEIPEPQERYKFALAAYNAGYDNINELLQLAREAEGYPGSYFRWQESGEPEGKWQTWEFAQQFLPQVTEGKARETINYVAKIMNGYYL